MKKIFITTFFLLGYLAVFCQSNAKILVNDPNAEFRKVGNFNSIEINNAITLYLSQGNEDAVAVSCSEAVGNNKIETLVTDGVLKISIKNGIWNSWNWGDLKIKAYISIRNIKSIKASGACSVKINDGLNTDKLKLTFSGASNLKGLIKTNDLIVDLSGASNINVTGSSNNSQIEVSGSSSFKSFSFITDNCKAEASGASSINIGVLKELNAEASGASSIKYDGIATIIQSNASGASSIKKKVN